MKKCLILILGVWVAATTAHGVTDLAAWESDLKFIQSTLPSKHPKLFFKVKRPEYVANLEKLRTELPKLTDYQAFWQLQKIVVAMGDDHTGATWKGDTASIEFFPVAIGIFRNEIYFLAVPEANKQALGAKLVAVGDVPVSKAISRLGVYISVASRTTVKTRLTNVFNKVDLWRLAGLAEPDGSLKITCETATHEPYVFSLQSETSVEFERHREGLAKFVPKSCPTANRPSMFYFTKKLDDGITLYVQYNKCWGREMGVEPGKNPSTLEGMPSHEEFFDGLRSELKTGKIKKLILDVRWNSGGSNGPGYRLAREIAQDRTLNQKGRLFVLVGRRTFSAALNVANEFRNRTKAVLIGEPTSGTSVHFGAVQYFTLPQTKILVQYSTKYIDSGGDDDSGGSLVPDIVIEPTFEDFANGIDPVADAALHYETVAK